ncbi:hypothetical protein JL108_18755 [Aeromicrobium sp. YIM 150415]|uniref:hypothetical protein n=1 Tax=Aeromicrobium sp. YIM 150415 TaxID=2803912 RepID=UPI001964D70B|nr:hypothetical protein [Aeromicrobium sp. YIM 150415]MBM9465495.1 hypothetical protein [Aeromicrobium sp. YIM 150415]
MSSLVVYLTSAYALAIAVYAGWHSWRGYRFSNPLFYALAVLEVILVGILIGAIVAYNGRDHDVDPVLFFSYLATVLVVPPVAVFWGVIERSRWGTGVVVIAMVTVAALMLRLQGIWSGTGSAF